VQHQPQALGGELLGAGRPRPRLLGAAGRGQQYQGGEGGHGEQLQKTPHGKGSSQRTGISGPETGTDRAYPSNARAGPAGDSNFSDISGVSPGEPEAGPAVSACQKADGRGRRMDHTQTSLLRRV